MTVTRFALRAAAAALMSLAVVLPSAAQEVSAVAQERDWAVFVGQENGGKVCTAVSKPKVVKPDGLNRGDIYFYVTIRPKEGVRSEISIKSGYPYMSGSETEVKVGNTSFKLFTNEDWAFTDNAAEEQRLIAAMKAGSSMIVTGQSSRGNTTIDTYSLLGITAALSRATQECN
ncbi:invasion associated locus B family protein [Tepidamorphus sp. 3E244]|uniref:invasion associated locus B family protein n=1 Tax=Tepidamorphus sp. 3E244 TaxID=3385498 RepID=UPI0038FC41EB